MKNIFIYAGLPVAGVAFLHAEPTDVNWIVLDRI